MQQLISIETVPITIEYVEKKPLKLSCVPSARLQIERQHNTMSIKSSPIHIKMDTFESTGSNDTLNLTYYATARYSAGGNLSLDLQMNNTETNPFIFKSFDRGIENIMDSLPGAAQSDSTPPDFNIKQINFDLSHLSGGMPAADNFDTSFLPPDLELRIVERPRVIIKYIGGPIYIPRSADPNYEPPENVNEIFNNKSNFDTKA